MRSAESYLRQQVGQGRTPGIHYAFYRGDEPVCLFAGGLADYAAQKPVEHGTSFHAFSVTKTFTATAVLQLVENGHLDLDRSARDLLPGIPYPDDIRIRHLLTHTGGIPNPMPLRWIHLAAEDAGFDANGFFKEVMERHPKPASAPGQRFAYSNLGYVLLGQVIERVSGRPYRQYVTENILDRLGLGPGEIGFTVSDPARHAKGYQRRRSLMSAALGLMIDKSKFMGPAEGPWRSFLTNYVNGSAYGGLLGTPEAFARYAQILSGPGGPLLGPEMRRRLFTENRTNDGRPTGMCLSWFTGSLNGKRFVAHAGGGGGYYCEVRIYPDDGYTSVVMCNRTGVKDERLLSKIDGEFL